MEEEEEDQEEEEVAEELIDRELDHSLETKSRQHNLTTVNVKNILHVSDHTYGPLTFDLPTLLTSHLVACRRSSLMSMWWL